MKERPKKWVHGYPKDAWRWSEDCRCYLHYMGVMLLPDSYCLGDRYIFAHFGKDSYGVLWHGSIPEAWNVRSFGYDLKSAMEWVHGAGHREMGCELWSK